jgi:penicillin-binding protein 1A
MNQIYLGQRAYGFGAAAQVYFGKPLAACSVAETAMLAGLPQNPIWANPVAPGARAARQRWCWHACAIGVIDAASMTRRWPSRCGCGRRGRCGLQAAARGRDGAPGGRGALRRAGLHAGHTRPHLAAHGAEQNAAHAGAAPGGAGARARSPGAAPRPRGPAGRRARPDRACRGAGPEGPPRRRRPACGHRAGAEPEGRAGAAGQRRGLAHLRRRPAQAPARAGATGRAGAGHAPRFGGPRDGRRSAATRDLEHRAVAACRRCLRRAGPASGRVRALVGGFDFNRRQFNHVTQRLAPAGLGFKPFLYSAALAGPSRPTRWSTTCRCCRRKGPATTGTRRTPTAFDGPITVRDAMARSKNLVSLRLLRHLGLRRRGTG